MSIVLDEELRGFRMEDDELDGGVDPDAVADDDELDDDELDDDELDDDELDDDE